MLEHSGRKDKGDWTPIILLTQVGESAERAMALMEGAGFSRVGLGLPLARAIIERHGGSVAVAAAPTKVRRSACACQLNRSAPRATCYGQVTGCAQMVTWQTQWGNK
ncbi:MAG: hypothetical protein P8X95_07550 [Anaerolineales bacterium]